MSRDHRFDLLFRREQGEMEMFQGEHSDRCTSKGDEMEDGGRERVELHAAGVRGLPWWLEGNDKKACQYRHLAHIRTFETRCGTLTFSRTRQRVLVWKKRIPLLQTSLVILETMSGSTLNEPASFTATHKTIWMAVKSFSTDSSCLMMACFCFYACVGVFISKAKHEGKRWRMRRGRNVV